MRIVRMSLCGASDLRVAVFVSACCALWFGFAYVPAHAADPFAENVRTTEPLSPADEEKSFHLPPGFEIQLVASEPDIAKPMNMAFDSKGRLWITDTVEYPYPVPLDKTGRDSIKVLEDSNGDGRADKITTFADGLNIPIGIYPYKSGVIAWSIPNIWYFEDTDGDGKADKREVLFGPLGWERDTHGNNASFRRGFDGWLYVTHGFNNNTVVRAKDGSEIRMNSGNVYRVQPDGSRVEQFTWGQVNPFGLCFDPFGNLYSADCHSAPIYQLLRGGYYPSFGKPHDGLGFAPVLLQHSHGSTAISGIIYYADDKWPEEYRGNLMIGNVMTSRVNRDTVERRGSTFLAREAPDFLRTDDPWFRPVDLQLGPDGALYIADFYNRIIGHYEVPLQHPGRDRHRGRIWRVSYKGGESAATAERYDISRAGIDQLIREIGHPNITRRMLAMNEVVDRIGPKAVQAVESLVVGETANPFQRSHGLWILHRLGGVPRAVLSAAAVDREPLVRTHAMRILSEAHPWESWQLDLARNCLEDADALVQRAAADALGQHPDPGNIQPLLRLLHRVPSEDTHLLHVVRMALRNQVRDHFSTVNLDALEEADARAIADVALGVQTPEAGSFILGYLTRFEERRDKLSGYLQHAARLISGSGIDSLVAFARDRFRGDADLQLQLLRSIQQGTAQRGGSISIATRVWGAELASKLLRASAAVEQHWVNLPSDGMPATTNPWFLQRRRSSDGDERSWFLCSLPPGGEHLTGILRSKPFRIPAKLSFFVAGHDGVPANPPQGKNLVRLRLETGEVAAEAPPPRDDTAQAVHWNLTSVAGKTGYIEVIDGDTGGAYAWLAIGRLDPAVVPWPEVSPSQIVQHQRAAAELAGALSLAELEPELRKMLADDATDLDACAAAARALIDLKRAGDLAALVPLIGDPVTPVAIRRQISRSLADAGANSGVLELAKEVMRTAPYRAQVRLADALAGGSAGADRLVALVSDGVASPRLLLERGVRDKLSAALGPAAAERIAKLTKNIGTSASELDARIAQRRAAFVPTRANLENGARVYRQNCASCHQIDGQGSSIGPQLDGIGNRGIERVLEDLLDPNRNVDRAFRTHVLTLKDGDIVSGLPRREEGELLVLADSAGKEISIARNEIDERFESTSSLMPSNFDELLSAADCNDLLAFLLAKRNGLASEE